MPRNTSDTELTKAERTARDSVPESAENVVSIGTEAEGAVAVVDSTVMYPVLVAPSVTTQPMVAVAGGSPSEASLESVDEPVADDLDDASAQSLVEARRDLT
jgi:hypothetical protein